MGPGPCSPNVTEVPTWIVSPGCIRVGLESVADVDLMQKLERTIAKIRAAQPELGYLQARNLAVREMEDGVRGCIS